MIKIYESKWGRQCKLQNDSLNLSCKPSHIQNVNAIDI